MAEKEEKQKTGVKEEVEEKMQENSPPKEDMIEIKVTSDILELKVAP